MEQREREMPLSSMQSARGEMLSVHPHCLMFFVDDSGHEEFADPKHPVYALGGCAVLAAAIDGVLKSPWPEIKARHFVGADEPLHASELHDLTPEQMAAIGGFFNTQAFGRFAVTMTASTALPRSLKAIEVMPGALRRRWEELTPHFSPLPAEVAFIHEASDRANHLLETYFGESVVVIDGKRVPAHHGIMPKGDEALEVADFIVQAAGAQAKRGLRPDEESRKDFAAVFRSNPLWSSFIAINTVTQENKSQGRLSGVGAGS
jgi:hypothetical protein